MHVDDLMTPEPVLVGQRTSIGECATLMARDGHRHLPVVDEQGRLWGLVTDFGVFQRGGLVGTENPQWVSFEVGDEALTAMDIAETAVLTALATESLAGCLRTLAESPQDAVVVLDAHQHPVGILTEHDGVRLARSTLTDTRDAGHLGTRPVQIVQIDAPARVAWQLMMTKLLRHVVVVQGERVAGVISARDLIEDDVPRGRELTCREILRTQPPITVPESLPLTDVASIMAHAKVGCLPVTDDQDRPQAIVTRTDLLTAVADALEDI